MEFRLGTILIKDNEQEITISQSITQQEFEEIDYNIKVLEKYSSNQELYSIFLINFLELSDYFQIAVNGLVSKQIYMLDNRMADFKLIYRNSNRLLLNLLASGRTLLDHTETYLKRKYGSNSEEANQFKTYVSKIYDNNFAYRFVYKLRNFAQHCELPISSISYSIKSLPEECKSTAILNPIFLKSTLLDNFDEWGKLVKQELLMQNREFSVMPIVADYCGCIGEIINSVILIDRLSLETAIKNLQRIVNQFESTSSDTQFCVFSNFEYSTPDSYENSRFDVLTIPTDLIEAISADLAK
jgi:hypothetical protein